MKTDLSSLGSKERAVYKKELGKEGLDAALRIRDRIVNSPPTGDRGIYLCHRFCELGSLPAEEMLRKVRDYLVLHPSEVLVIVNEDYVSAEDFVQVVKDSGLADYVYKGPLSPLPTPRQMIESGGRVLLMAENHAGAAPWYHSAYDQLLQETPFTFKQPAELLRSDELKRSCKPNRGPDDAPLFLLNHWVDTSPAAKPSNAEKVNAFKPLLRRARECERLRDHMVNLLAVDFYREGDVFGVADRLNGVKP